MNKIKLKDLQPSQFYISFKKLKDVQRWFNPNDLSNFEAIPVKIIDGKPVMTDGHTRAVAALQAGLDSVALVLENDKLDWDMYRACVKECEKRGVLSPEDLLSQIVSEEEYIEKWDKWCDRMQEEILKNRK